MADQASGRARCPVCSTELHAGTSYCGSCGAAVAPPSIPDLSTFGGAPNPPPAPPPIVPRPASGWEPMGSMPMGRTRTVESVARAWGGLSLAFGLLVLLGSALPWFDDVDWAVIDDIGSGWPLLAIGFVAVLGGIDGLRGSLAGPAVAAGIGSVFVLLQATLLYTFDDVPNSSMGSGSAVDEVIA
jgi:hypothetical protein